jgi:hypothetical protein
MLRRDGQRKLIGGRDDQLIDIALKIKREQDYEADVAERGRRRADRPARRRRWPSYDWSVVRKRESRRSLV